MVNFAPTVVNHQDGRGVHDSPPGLGATHSILQRRINRKCLVEQSRHVSRQKHVLLSDPQLPPALVNAQTKPLSQELTKLTKRIRQFPGGVGVGAPGGPPGEEGEEEEGDLVTGPVEQWLKRMIKGSPSTPKPSITPATPKGKTTSKIVKKWSPSTSLGDDISRRLEAIRERRKTLEKKVAESSWGKGKGPAREVERLKPLPGWEDWYRGKKLRRRLDYDSD